MPSTFIENIFAKPKDVVTPHPTLDVDCFIQQLDSSKDALTLGVELRDGDRVVARAHKNLRHPASTDPMVHTVHLDNLGSIKLWDLTKPNLYNV